MRVLLAVTTLVVVASANNVSLEEQEFHAWKLQFGKSYDSEGEESRRKMTWMNNRKLIEEHNQLADQGIKGYTLGMNQFGDMDNEEYQAMFSNCLGAFNITEEEIETETEFLKEDHGRLPRSLDWRRRGYVTDVKNQRQCGSCWAFSATGALEGQLFKKKRKLISLSEQQLVDCSRRFGNHGCQGGWPHRAFQYVKASGGIQADYSYPYKARGQRCRFNRRRVKATCRGYKKVPSGNENALKKAVAKVGPIAVAIDTSKHTFQFYKKGVYNEPGCSSKRLTHAVVLTGYGQQGRKKFWLVKNSWGVQWGNNGYIKMSRGKRNQCGIASVATYPLM